VASDKWQVGVGEWGSSYYFIILKSFVRLFFIGGLASGEWLVGSG